MLAHYKIEPSAVVFFSTCRKMQPTTPEVSCPEEEWFIQGSVPQYLQPAVPKRIVIMQSNTFYCDRAGQRFQS